MSVTGKDSGVVVLTEVEQRKPTRLAYELLSVARQLSKESHGLVCAVMFGSNLQDVAQELIFQGADRVYLADGESLAEYQEDRWLSVLAEVVQEVRPAVVLCGQTSIGSDLAPRLAFRLKTAIATDCENLRIQSGKAMATRSCYGGKARAVVSFRQVPAVATIRPKCQNPLKREPERNGEVIALRVDSISSVARTVRVGRRSEGAGDAGLENAEVVVAGGRGLNGAEGFRLLEELASVLGAALGASRVACDLGWCSTTRQIGLTGKIVTPDLYIAVGISGASQHMAGCGGAKTIVAINTDPNANIFKAARFGVVADFKQVVPFLIEDLRQLRRSEV